MNVSSRSSWPCSRPRSVMFARDKPRMDAVALLMLALLPLTGVITMSEALAGFADANVVLIALAVRDRRGLVRTGVAQRLGDWLVAKAGSSETRLLVLLMLVVGGLGSVMSSTGVVAIFIPIVLRIAQNTGIAPSRLMMPLSVAALISGMMTLVATAPNLVVDAELRRSGAAGFEFFSFTPFGLAVLALGILYMLFARRWLAADADTSSGSAGRPRLRDWIEEYRLAGRERRVRGHRSARSLGRASTLEELTTARQRQARTSPGDRARITSEVRPRRDDRSGAPSANHALAELGRAVAARRALVPSPDTAPTALVRDLGGRSTPASAHRLRSTFVAQSGCGS